MKTLAVTLICMIGVGGCTMGGDISVPLLKIEGVKVSTQTDAKDIAFDAYVRKMNLEILANEGVRDVGIVTLGYGVPDFAKEGERIWEARVLTMEGRLRAIVWVNPQSGNVLFVCGPWDEKAGKK